MKSKDIKKDEISYVAQLTEEYRQYYEDVKKVKGLEFEVKEMKTAKSKSKAVKKKDYLSPLNDNLVDDEIIEDVDKRFFETVKSRLKSNLEEKLGLELASKLELTQDKRGEPFFLKKLGRLRKKSYLCPISINTESRNLKITDYE